MRIWQKDSSRNSQQKEKLKYDLSASLELQDFLSGKKFDSGLMGIPELHCPPYLEYYGEIRKLLKPHHKVLELAAGSGRHTRVLVETGAEIYALDISEEALKILSIRTENKAKVVAAPMEEIPLPSDTFDFIVGCGGMSYVSNKILLFEINRLLKPGGGLIFLDSLNHNPIYMTNRFIQLLRGKRTLLTFFRMPTYSFIKKIELDFANSNLQTFGNFLWLQHLSLKFYGTSHPKLLKYLEKNQNSRWAFKFVLTCQNLRK